MARMIKSTQSMILSAKISTCFEDGSVTDRIFKVNDVVENLRFVVDGEIVVVSGRVSAINYAVPTKITWNKNNPSNTLSNDIVLTTMVIDNSAEYNSNTVTVPFTEIVEWKDETNVSRMKFAPVITYDLTLNYSDNSSVTSSVQVGDKFDNVKLFNPADPANLITGTYTVVGFAYKLLNKQISVTGIAFKDDNTSKFVVSDFDCIFALNEVYTYDIETPDDITTVIAKLASGDALTINNEVNTIGHPIAIADNKKVSLTINGNLKANNSSSSSGLSISNGADVTINGDGKFIADANYDKTHANGVVNVCNASVTFNGSGIDCVRENAASNGQFGVCVYGDSKAIINGGDFKAGWYCFAGNGTYQSNYSEIVINDGTLVSTVDYAIYHPQKGKLTINGGVIDGASGAIAINSGDLIINGGTLQSFGNGETANLSNDGTNGLSNAVLNLSAKYGDVTCTITGGTFKSSGDSVIISTGSRFNVAISISGGKFNTTLDPAWIAEGYHLTTEPDKNGFYEVIVNA